MFLSIGRWYLDPTLWREFVAICVDGKLSYSRRSIGRLPDPKMVGASCLQIECLAPLKTWHLRYHGPALCCDNEELVRRPPIDAVASLLHFDLRWEAVTALIDYGHGTELALMSSHIEQGGNLTGSVSIDGRNYPVNCRSFRDHSRGRCISSLTVQSPDLSIPIADMFVVQTDGATRKFRFDTPLLWESWEGRTNPYTLRATADNGEKICIEAQPLFAYPLSMGHPSDVFIGQSNSFNGWRVYEMPTRLIWGDEQACGLTEISLSAEKSRNYPED